MPPLYKEARFPPDYRQAQVRQIMRALFKLRSLAITGLAGMGKSNLVRFVVSHPEVRPRYLQARADEFVLIHVDCSSLPANAEPELLEEISAELRSAKISPRPLSTEDSIRHRLREQILGLPSELTLVIAFDYFDAISAALNQTFFNYLFHLRNARPRGNMSFLFVTRRTLPDLGELQDLMDDDCVVGPLDPKDALGSLQRDEARLNVSFDATARERLIMCTGGHPGLLKNAAELVADGRANTGLSDEEFMRQLLRSQKMQNLCRALWSDLNSGEQSVLVRTVQGISISADESAARLEQYGILIRDPRGRPVLFSPLFGDFIRAQAPAPGALRIAAVYPNQARIETTTGEELVRLSPKLFALLKTLTDAQGQVLRADDLIAQVYGDEAAGVTDAALAQLVKRLRLTLDPHIQPLLNDRTYTCVETVRDIGYRLSA